MINQIMIMFSTVMASVTNIFTQVINATGTGGLVIAFFFIFMVIRFIVKPFIGSAGNSTISKAYKGGNKDAS